MAWTIMIGVAAAMFGACVGFVTLGFATAAKGDADDQRQSDEAQLDFLARWQEDRQGRVKARRDRIPALTE